MSSIFYKVPNNDDDVSTFFFLMSFKSFNIKLCAPLRDGFS